ncbi:MAG TPA: 4Fe-4S dicluster domain-containing protein [Candidatus Aminicenantes bacterium]|nr:4Fe-4S dicluster domain-containing protein [Candidatus Aminicenantes bacterium]
MKNIKSTPDLQPGRRRFMRNILFGAFSASLASVRHLSGEEKQRDSLKKGQMSYRRLGRTNLLISEISLGGSPLPAMPILYQAIERGVNYIDSSNNYSNGNCERQIGKILKEFGRDKVYVATKFHLRGPWSEESIINSVNGSLRRLDTDYMDVCLIHGVADEKHLTDERVVGAFEKLKKQGKYRFRGFSCHSNHQKVVKEAIDCGYYDMIQLAFNVFDIQETEDDVEVYDDYLGQSGIRRLLALAKSKDVGVNAMKILKVAGKRQNLEKYRTGNTTIYQAMLKWVLESKNLTSAVIEMLTWEQLEEDLGVIGEPLSEMERKNLFRYVAENSEDYCHMCGECEASCPSHIKTTAILRYLAYYENYGKIGKAKKAYSRLKQAQTATACQDCGECERVCPYGVSIRKKIREAHTALSC